MPQRPLTGRSATRSMLVSCDSLPSRSWGTGTAADNQGRFSYYRGGHVSKTQSLHRVNIRPSVSVLSVLRHLNYKPWFALAEFVDNAIQSYFDKDRRLRAAAGKKYQLRVEIEVNPDDGGQIIVRDNAAGIALGDFPRAFRPAEIPPDSSGLCEFGMGMKS